MKNNDTPSIDLGIKVQVDDSSMWNDIWIDLFENGKHESNQFLIKKRDKLVG